MTQMTHKPTPISVEHHHPEEDVHNTIHLPAPTAYPFLMSLGIMLVVSSLVFSALIAWLGLALTAIGAVGWFRQVLPHEAHDDIPVDAEIVDIVPSKGGVERMPISESHRAQLPLETFPITNGIKGGIAGGIAMVIPAEIYGILRYHSIWYVVNLLGGAGVGSWTNPTMYQLTHFRLSAFITANIIQGAATLLVGILYGAMLPVWPKRPILLGGIIAPVVWTGLLHTVLGIVNPFLQQRIDWGWFIASQVVFGVVAGYVVSRLGGLKRLEQIPLAVRLGIESPGLEPHEGRSHEMESGNGEGRNR